MVDTTQPSTPTADEAFGSLPTADQAFSGGPDPSSGSLADYAFSQGPLAHIMGAFGQGFSAGWGSEPAGFSPESEKELSKAGVFNDYSTGRVNLLKSFNEAFMRPAATALDTAMRLPGAVLSGAAAGLQEAGTQEEKTSPVLGSVIGEPLKGLGELAGIASQGGGLEAGIQTEGFHQTIRARAEAAIGEDEGSFFGTKSPTEAQAEARAEAVGQLHVQGIQPDIHNVARQLAPETFAHYDALTDQADQLSKTLQAVKDDRANDPDVQESQGKIQSILDRVNGNEEELSDKGQEELSRARDDHQDTLNKVTPEIQEIQDRLAQINGQLVNLSPDVRSAYQEADKALNPGSSGAATRDQEVATQNATRSPQEPVQGATAEAATPVAPENQGTQRASQGLSGEIASDVSKRLVKAGRPLQEADAVGQLIEAHYNSRAERFDGKLGTGKDLYDREFPDIQKAAEYKKLVNTLNQAGLRVALKDPEGKVIQGQLGDIHANLLPDFELHPERFEDGFVTPEGEYLNRKQAMSWVEKNQPDVAKKLDNLDTLDFRTLTHLESVKYDKARGLKQDQRGAITLREGRNLIRLFKDADASTFLHETGHQWLEELMKDGAREGAPKDLVDDVKTVRDFLKNDTGIVTRAQHEKFARTFERYLREGNAPSRGLARVFEKFKTWLTQVYRKVGQLKAPINDDIRQVFDRLITTPSKREAVVAPERLYRGSKSTGEQAYLTDDRSVAEMYAGKEGKVTEHSNNFKNLLKTENWMEAKKQLDLPMSATMPELIQKATEAGYDGLSFKTTNGQEYVRLKSEAAPENANPSVPGESGEAPAVAPTETPKGQTEPNPGVATEEGTEGQAVPKAEKPSEEVSSETPLKVEPAGNIKIENLTSEADLQTFIKQFYDEHKQDIDKRRGKISDSDLLNLAEASGLKASDINVAKLQEMSVNDGIPYSARVLGLRQAFLDSAKNAWDVSRKEPADPVAFQQAKERHLWLQQVLTQVTGEAGRTLRVFKNLEGGKGAMSDAKALSEFFQSTVGQPVERILEQMKLASNLKDVSQVSGFIRDSEKASIGEMLLEFYRNNLISGPITHMTYAAGNKIFALYKAFPERLATAAVGSIRETLTGKTGTERAYAGEAGEGLYAMLFGQRDGLKAAKDSFIAGQTLPLPGEDVTSTPFTRTKAIPGILGTILRAPGERMVAPIHSFDRTVGYLTNRAQLIYRRAMSEGLDGEALNQRIAELEKDTPDDLVKAASAEATSQSLMGRPGEPTRRFLSFIRTEFDLPLLGRTQPGSFVAPFISVVSNINRQAFLERGPLGLLSKSFWENATGKNGTLAQDTSLAKMGLGIAVAGTAAGLLLQGKTTPAASSNYHQATVDEMVQGIPHGITIGNMSYQFNRLGIVGVMMAMATDVAYAGKAGLESDDYTKGVSLLLHSLGETFTQEGMMSGISDLLNAVDDPDRYGKNYLSNMLDSFIPFSVGDAQVAHLADPYQRDARGWLESVKNKIPGLTEDLQPKIDLFGQQVPNKEYYGVYAEQVSKDPVWQAFKTNGYSPAPVERKINGIQLSDQEYHDYAVKAGLLSKMLLNQIVGMPNFTQLSPGTRHDMLRDAVTSGRGAARSWMLINYPDIMVKSTNMKYNLTHAGHE